jgi:hypothetical protein
VTTSFVSKIFAILLSLLCILVQPGLFPGGEPENLLTNLCISHLKYFTNHPRFEDVYTGTSGIHKVWIDISRKEVFKNFDIERL